MEEYKVVKVDADCTELNAAAVDGFFFCAWIPGPPETWPKALCVRPESAAKRLEHLVEQVAGYASSDTFSQLAMLAADRFRAATEPAPPPEHEEPPAEVPAAPPPAPDPAPTPAPAPEPQPEPAGAA